MTLKSQLLLQRRRFSMPNKKKKRITEEEIDKILEDYGIEKVPENHWIYKESPTAIFIKNRYKK